MKPDTLLERKKVIEAKFNDLETRQTELGNEWTTNTEEMVRLQGEHRVVTELIDELEKGASNATVKSGTK